MAAIDLRGTAGSVTYAGAEAGANAIIVGDIVLWTARASRERTDTTRPGYVMRRYSYSPLQVEGIIRIVTTAGVSGASPTTATPIPLGVSASLVLLEDTTSSQGYTVKASLFAMTKTGVQSHNGAPQQWTEYAFCGDATTTSETMVPS